MSGLNNSERQLLQQLVTRLNLIEQNAKKIDELPLKSTLNGNDLLHISENGTSKKITMSNLLDIVQNRSFDHLVSVTNMQLIGNQFSVESATWEISSILNTLSFPFLQNIPYSASGMLRRDIVVGNTNNELVYIQGEENEGISFAPPIPPSTVFITEFDVTDNSVNNSQPIIGDNFKKKIESGYIDLYNAGSLPSLAINNPQRNLIIHNATDLHSLSFGIYSDVYAGQLLTITNKKSTPVPLYHLSNNPNAGNVKFVFPNGANYTLKPNETIEFFLSQDLTKLNFLGSNMSVASSQSNVVLLDLNASGDVYTQGVTGNVVLKTYNIPMSLLRKNGVFRISVRMAKPEGVEVIFNTSVNLGANSEQFGLNLVNSGNANNKYVSATREVKSIYNSSLPYFTMTSFGGSGGYYTGWLAHASIPTQANVFYSGEYLPVRLSINTTSTTDKIVLDYLMIEFLSE